MGPKGALGRWRRASRARFANSATLQRILARALARCARRLGPGRDVHADGGHREHGLADVRRVEAAGQRDRDLAGDGGGEGRVDPDPGAAGVGTAGGVEQDPGRAGVEERPRGARPRRPRRRPGPRAGPSTTGRPTAATADGGSSPLSWTSSGSTAAIDPGQLGRRQVRGDHDDPRPGRSPGADARARRASSTPSSIDSARGVPGAKLSPIASAPARIAARIPAASVTPQIFTPGSRASPAGSAGYRPAATNARAAAAGSAARISASPDERRVEPGGPPAGDRRGVADPGLGDGQAVAGDRVPQPDGPLRVHVERPQVPVVDPDEPGAGREGALELARVVRLHERLQAQVARGRHEPGQALRRVQHRQQEHEVGAGGPEEVELPRVDDELLGQDRHGDGRPHGAQVVDGAAEPVGLAQDGDGGRAAGGVGPGARDRVVRGGDGPGGGRAALDLGDEVEAGGGERLGDRARRGGGGNRAPEPVAAERVQLRDDVGQAPGGDLGDHARGHARPPVARRASCRCRCRGRLPPRPRAAPRAACRAAPPPGPRRRRGPPGRPRPRCSPPRPPPRARPRR